ncbi:hypothetical protein [Alkalihalobacillus sp. 1P02AB]
MEKETSQTIQTDKKDTMDVISAFIYKAISNKLLSEQNKERV